MAYVIIKPADFKEQLDLMNFSPDDLTDNARIYFDRYQVVYYSDKEKESVCDMRRLK
jgi:hypothetical protein